MSSQGEVQVGWHLVVPYLNPGYWGDGHTFGRGELTEPRTLEVPTKGTTLFAAGALQTYLDLPGPRFGERIWPGEVFDADNHYPATIVAIRQELLTSQVPELPFGQRFEESDPLPNKDTSLPSSKDLSGTELLLRSQDNIVQYSSFTMWGVVVRERRKRAGLVMVLPHQITFDPPRSKVIPVPPFFFDPAPITIDQTVHHIIPVAPWGIESLGRVTALEICTTPSPPDSQHPLPTALWAIFAKHALSEG